MKFFIVLSALAAVTLAKPGHLLASHPVVAPLAYAKLVPGAPIGLDGRVVDTPEVAHAKVEHEAAHINEKINLAHEAHKSADILTYAAAPAIVATSYHSNEHTSLPVATSSYHGAQAYHAVAPVSYAHLVAGAPIGLDGRVVDTPEVAHAKAAHAAAHVHEKINLAHEEAKSSYYAAPQLHHLSAYSSETYAPHYYNAHHSAAPLVSVW